VLIPLKELAPDLILEGGEGIDEALQRLDYRLEGKKIWQNQADNS
jgi:2-amino-4-hydroxy-6-hydroxymethyldihydropteridine diphosphokinase